MGLSLEKLTGRELDRVTNRESDVITLICKGLSNKEIAGRLGIAETTVKRYVQILMAKLDIGNRFQLISWGYENRQLGYPEVRERLKNMDLSVRQGRELMCILLDRTYSPDLAA